MLKAICKIVRHTEILVRHSLSYVRNRYWLKCKYIFAFIATIIGASDTIVGILPIHKN